MPINVAIVEDNKDLREMLVEILSSFKDLNCIADFADAEEFSEVFRHLNADVVLMDIMLPGRNGIQTVAMLKPIRPRVQFMMLTSFDQPDKTFDSLCAGATGYLLKNSPPEKLYEAIKEIHNGGSPMSPQIARMVVTAFTNQQVSSTFAGELTEREKEILQLLSKGLRYKEIAGKLFLSVETIRTYVRKIYAKLEVHSRTEALNKVFPSNGR